jgi:hypothetical protein
VVPEFSVYCRTSCRVRREVTYLLSFRSCTAFIVGVARGTSAIISDSDVEHLADSSQGLPDAHATVKHLIPKSDAQANPPPRSPRSLTKKVRQSPEVCSFLQKTHHQRVSCPSPPSTSTYSLGTVCMSHNLPSFCPPLMVRSCAPSARNSLRTPPILRCTLETKRTRTLEPCSGPSGCPRNPEIFNSF